MGSLYLIIIYCKLLYHGQASDVIIIIIIIIIIIVIIIIILITIIIIIIIRLSNNLFNKNLLKGFDLAISL